MGRNGVSTFVFVVNATSIAFYINQKLKLFCFFLFLFVLMKDCQVTGGYPRVLQLSEYAISRLSQKVTEDNILFKFK